MADESENVQGSFFRLTNKNDDNNEKMWPCRAKGVS